MKIPKFKNEYLFHYNFPGFNHYLPGGIYIHAMAVDKVGGVKRDTNSSVGSDSLFFSNNSGIIYRVKPQKTPQSDSKP